MSSQRNQNKIKKKRLTLPQWTYLYKEVKVDTPNGSLQIQQTRPITKMTIPSMERKASFYSIELSI